MMSQPTGYIKVNPMRDVKLTVKGQDMEDGYAYSVKEIELILEALERVTGREEYSAKMAGMVITTCFYAGLRPSEAAGLRWENVTADTLQVKEAYVAGSHKGTKTGRTRTVVMLQQLRHRMGSGQWRTSFQLPVGCSRIRTAILQSTSTAWVRGLSRPRWKRWEWTGKGCTPAVAASAR